MNKFIKMFIDTFMGSDGKTKYRCSSAPKSPVEVLDGIIFGIGEFTPGTKSKTDLSGFADIDEVQWKALKNVFSEGYFWYNPVTKQTMSENEYAQHQLQGTDVPDTIEDTPQPSQSPS